MDQSPEKAIEIASAMLARTSRAIMEDDFDALADCFEFPNRVESESGVRIVATRDELKTIFIALVRTLKQRGVTHYERRCLAAEFRGPDEVATTHETRLMHGSQMLSTPYPAFGTITRINGNWKITTSQYAVTNTPEIDKALHTPYDFE